MVVGKETVSLQKPALLFDLFDLSGRPKPDGEQPQKIPVALQTRV
jgi:hypothetical protein